MKLYNPQTILPFLNVSDYLQGNTAIVGTSTAFNNTQASIQSVANNIGLAIRGAAFQSADIQQWQDSTSNPLVVIKANGDVRINSTTPSNSRITGALIVTGGIGTNGAINSGNIAVTGQVSATGALVGPLIRTGDITAGLVNIPASNLSLRTGLGTGSANPPSILFSTANPGDSGSTPQTASEKMRLSGTGRLLVGSTTDDLINIAQFNGSIKATQFRQSANSTPPTSPTDTGVLGEVKYSQDYIYYCYATNNWSRFAKDNVWT